MNDSPRVNGRPCAAKQRATEQHALDRAVGLADAFEQQVGGAASHVGRRYGNAGERRATVEVAPRALAVEADELVIARPGTSPSGKPPSAKPSVRSSLE